MRFIYSLIVHQSIFHIASGSAACLSVVEKGKKPLDDLMLDSYGRRHDLFKEIGNFFYTTYLACRSNSDKLQTEYEELRIKLEDYWSWAIKLVVGSVKIEKINYLEKLKKSVNEAL